MILVSSPRIDAELILLGVSSGFEVFTGSDGPTGLEVLTGSEVVDDFEVRAGCGSESGPISSRVTRL